MNDPLTIIATLTGLAAGLWLIAHETYARIYARAQTAAALETEELREQLLMIQEHTLAERHHTRALLTAAKEDRARLIALIRKAITELELRAPAHPIPTYLAHHGPVYSDRLLDQFGVTAVATVSDFIATGEVARTDGRHGDLWYYVPKADRDQPTHGQVAADDTIDLNPADHAQLLEALT